LLHEDHYTWWRSATETNCRYLANLSKTRRCDQLPNRPDTNDWRELIPTLALAEDPDTVLKSAAAVAYRQAVESVKLREHCQVQAHESHLRQQHAILDAGASLAQIAVDTELGLQINSREGLSILGSNTSRTPNSRMGQQPAANAPHTGKTPPPALSTRSHTNLTDQPISELAKLLLIRNRKQRKWLKKRRQLPASMSKRRLLINPKRKPKLLSQLNHLKMAQ
jgi:hypothetical protein